LPESRGLPDRGPYEVAVDCLLQLKLKPDDPQFAPLLDDARLMVRRGDPLSALKAFTHATEVAVATVYKDGYTVYKDPPVPDHMPQVREDHLSKTWENSTYKVAAEELQVELRKWDDLLRRYGDLPLDEIKNQAEVCSKKLAAMALQCDPIKGEFSKQAAFSSLTGIAMVMAVGERLQAQISSRVADVTVQGLYDRLTEIPNRDVAPKAGSIDKAFAAGFDKLGKVWTSQMEGISKGLNASVQAQLKGMPDDAEAKKKLAEHNQLYLDLYFGKNKQEMIGNALSLWDRIMKDTNNLMNGQKLGQLREESVGPLVKELLDMRRYFEFPDARIPVVAKDIYEDARKKMLRNIDALIGQMQNRLALARKVTG
jgi:hypothetical protein